MVTAADLTLLHTSPVHVPVFDALRDRHHPGAVLRHLVVPELLDLARAHGPASVAPALRDLLAGAGPRPVLVTCSTIGATAEAQAPALGAPVLRVDRPMAAAAVRTGPRIAVLAALASTLAPTAELLAEEAGGRPVSVATHLVAGAWDSFEAGDTAGYLTRVAEAADTVTGADVIVLAQASMAGAAGLATTGTPVLASPRPGLAAALALSAAP
ncbi:aspartate/glutamate racemase family protein [Streptomyces erythrochromogenes]|uniref:aspartate/glutamate racemase family protein n=1 Tax=Streptomyces erythrochromogenes TaxID=285574 RepID=UPI0037F838BA